MNPGSLLPHLVTDLDVLKPFITSRAIAPVRGNKKKLSKEGTSIENVGT
jgi:hypothetical protein